MGIVLSHEDDEAPILNLANFVTLCRLFAFVWGLWLHATDDHLSGAIWMAAAYFGDYIDGIVARQFSMRTKFGAMFDATLDKGMMVATLSYISWRVPLEFRAVLLAILAYEVVLGLLVLRAQKYLGYTVMTTYLGKKAMVGRMIAVCGALFMPLEVPGWWEPVSVYSGLIGFMIGLAAAWQYYWQVVNRTDSGAKNRPELWPKGYWTAGARIVRDPFGLKARLGLRIEE